MRQAKDTTARAQTDCPVGPNMSQAGEMEMKCECSKKERGLKEKWNNIGDNATNSVRQKQYTMQTVYSVHMLEKN